MLSNRIVSGKISTAGKNFTPPPVLLDINSDDIIWATRVECGGREDAIELKALAAAQL